MSLYLVFQASSLPGHAFANPVWSIARSLIGDVPDAITVDPAATLASILPLAMPFLLYGAALALFPSDEEAFRLFGVLGAIGTALALFGFIQVAFLPKSLLFTEKVAYLDSLTSVFVNRNTAATLFGVSALACLILLLRMVRQVSGRSALSRLLFSPTFSRGRRSRAALLLFCIAACLLALLLTRSRGAALSTAASFLLVLPLLFREMGAGRSQKRRQRWLFGAALALLAVGGVILVFGQQFVLRLETRGVDTSRLCVYQGTLRAFEDNWLFGTGFGTFEAVFRGYRPVGCGSAYETFRQAHNVFLEGLLGMGIVFVPLALIVYGHLASVLLHGLRTRKRLRFVPIVTLGAVLLVTLHSLVDFSVQIPGMAAILAAFLGAATTISLGRPSGVRRSRLDRRYTGAD
ncbi:hypothetical protein ASG62_00110 [Aureimonas sp. Leaf427]|nr:hypothetical protein ASG62_00110 [Aureimonas sp. Leaf427]